MFYFKLTPSQKNDLSQILKVNSSIYLQIPNFSSDNCEHFISSGIVVSVFDGGFSVYFNQPIDDSTPFLVYFLSNFFRVGLTQGTESRKGKDNLWNISKIGIFQKI